MINTQSLTLIEALEKLKNKEFTSFELTEQFIKNIEDQGGLNAFITKTFDLAIDSAKESDKRISAGEMKKLDGIPLSIKDLMCTEGVLTTAGSKMLEKFVPPYESTITKNLKKEGYVMLGKTNTDEFGAAGTTKTSYFGSTKSIFKDKNDSRDLTAGGSSGGSAVSIAANMCLGSTGTDTGGSIRQPAAYCNAVGIKPTYGRISRYGVSAYASSFDQAGPIAKNVGDASYLLEIMCGYDDKDSTSLNKPVPYFYANLNENIRGKKIGIVKEYMEIGEKENHPDIQASFLKSIQKLKDMGAEIIEVSIPSLKYASALYSVISYTEIASNLARYDGVRYTHRSNDDIQSLDDMYEKTRAEGFGMNLKKRSMIGYYASSFENYEEYFIRGQKIRRILSNDVQKAFENVDTYILPTTPNLPFPLNTTAEEEKNDIAKGRLNDMYVCPANLCGLPAMSVPCGFSKSGLPMGLQIVGKHFEEQDILNIALALENSLK